MSDHVVLPKTNWSHNLIKTIDEKFIWRQVGPILAQTVYNTVCDISDTSFLIQNYYRYLTG